MYISSNSQIGCIRWRRYPDRDNVPFASCLRRQRHSLLLHTVQTGHRRRYGCETRQLDGTDQGTSRVQRIVRRDKEGHGQARSSLVKIPSGTKIETKDYNI